MRYLISIHWKWNDMHTFHAYIMCKTVDLHTQTDVQIFFILENTIAQRVTHALDYKLCFSDTGKNWYRQPFILDPRVYAVILMSHTNKRFNSEACNYQLWKCQPSHFPYKACRTCFPYINYVTLFPLSPYPPLVTASNKRWRPNKTSVSALSREQFTPYTN